MGYLIFLINLIGVSFCQALEVKGNAFFDGQTHVTLRGANYTRLDPAIQYHITFSQYDRQRAKNGLLQLSNDGYNVVRVFIEPGAIAFSSSPVLDPIYINNLIDFIKMAKSLGIYVIIAKDIWLPLSYINAYTKPDLYGEFGNFGSAVEFNINQMILDPSFISAAQKFWENLASALSVPTIKSHVIAFDIYQEAHYRADLYPFSLYQGNYRAYTQLSYRMDKAEDRQQLADAMAVEFANQLRKAVKHVFPEVLVTMSTFTPLDIGQISHNGLIPSPGLDQRRPFRHRSLDLYSDLDFTGVHLYAADGTINYMEMALQSAEITKNRPLKKVLIVDEIGFFKFNHSNLIDVAQVARMQIDLLCDYKVAGWLFWTLDTFEQVGFYHLMSGQGEINGLLAPIARQDQKCRL